MQETIIQEALDFVRAFFARDFSGHDYFHTQRVFRMATHLAKQEGADLLTVQLAALLHDVDDIKLSPQTHPNKDNARRFLADHQMSAAMIEHICHVIDQVAYAGRDSVIPDSLEGQCVQDADRLDAIGAMGIARAFAFGGSHNRVMYDPDVPPKMHMSREEYHHHKATTINHFYEKLFLLTELMSTPTARQIALARQQYMQAFIEEFMAEWDGIR